MSERRRRYEFSIAELRWLQRDFDETEYLEDLDAEARARNRHPAVVVERDVGSDAERAQNPETSR